MHIRKGPIYADPLGNLPGRDFLTPGEIPDNWSGLERVARWWLRGTGRDKPTLLIKEDELNLAWIFAQGDVALKMACLVTEV